LHNSLSAFSSQQSAKQRKKGKRRKGKKGEKILKKVFHCPVSPFPHFAQFVLLAES